MRSLHLCALLVSVAATGMACGDDNGPSNTAPTAAFTPNCTALACTFTDASSDPESDALTYQWNFGESASGANNTSTTQSPSHSYAAAGAYHVTLTVTDDNGAASAPADSLVTVSAPAGPTAGFTVTCNGVDCSFTDTSTPADGTLTFAWDFGEPASGASNTSTAQNPTHSYNVTDVTDVTVTLTVTDPQSATSTKSQTITVTPPAGLECDGVTCTLDITEKATLTITLVSSDCELANNRFAITSPIQQTVFTNGCNKTQNPDGKVYPINGPNPDGSFDAGTQLEAQFTQGVGDPTDPTTVPPAIQLTGTFRDWTIRIDDGGNPTGPGEPDFDDIVLSVHATTVP
jgi:PKD repeat protein